MRQQKIELQNGHVYTTPTIPLDHLIAGHQFSEKEQYWRRPIIPKHFKELPPPEKNKIIDSFWEMYYDGYWFMNNGKAVFMPPCAWFFFALWKGEYEGMIYPEFRMQQLERFYLDELAENDPLCIGTYEFKQRRDGATTRRVSSQVKKGIQAKRKWFGIISKTYDDAKNVCWNKLMMGYKGLPPFMKPQQAGMSDPKKELIFDKPARRITRKNMVDEEEAEGSSPYLETHMTYRATATNSFDGMKLYDLLIDEYAKFPSEVSPSQTLSTHKKCVVLGNKKVGHIHIVTSPIEVMCQSFEDSVELWNNSDYTKINEFNGTTQSGLWRWFSSARKCLEGFIDIYGYCDEERAEEFIMQERKKCTTAQELRSQILQQPLYIEEITDATNLETIFSDQEAIKNRKHFIIQTPFKDAAKQEPASMYGNLIWKDSLRDTQTEFKLSSNQNVYSGTGKWRFAYLPKDDETNNFILKGDNKFPPKAFQFVMGIDPFDFRRVEGKSPSRGASHVLKVFDVYGHGLKNVLFSQYCWRPKPEEFFEDMIKQAVFFGAKVQFEAKNMKIADWFEDRGYWDFLMNKDLKKRDERKGNPTTPDLIQEMSSLIDQYLSRPIIEGEQNNFDFIWFDDLLDDVLGFDPNNTQKYDLTMSLGQTLLGAQKLRFFKRPKQGDGGFVKNFMEYLSE